MKLLSDILYKVGIIDVNGATNVDITKVCFNSRETVKNCLFVAIKGIQHDGHKYIQESIDRGAIAVVCENMDFMRAGSPSPEGEGRGEVEKVTYIKVKNSSIALGYIASNFYDNPSTQ